MDPRGNLDVPSPAAASLWQRLRDGWKRVAHAVGMVQTRIVLLVFYLVIVLPIGILVRLFSDPLRLRRPRETNWIPVPQRPPSLESAQRQY